MARLFQVVLVEGEEGMLFLKFDHARNNYALVVLEQVAQCLGSGVDGGQPSMHRHEPCASE